MSSYLEIATLAAAELASEAIQSIDTPQSALERTLAALVRIAWKETLEASAAWVSPRRRIVIPRSAGANDTPAFGYLYAYRLPANFARMVRVYNSAYRWKREGKQILSDDPGPLNVSYIALIEPGDADPSLIAAAAARLAWRAARRGTDGATERSRLWNEWQARKNEAETIQGSQRDTEDAYPSPGLDVAGIDQVDPPYDAVERSR